MMKYSLSYPSRLRLTANDRHAVESGIAAIRSGKRDGSSVNSVGLQYGRSKYLICRSPELKSVDGYLTAAEITGMRQIDTNDAHAEAWTLAEHVGMSDAEGEGLIQKLNEALAEAYR